MLGTKNNIICDRRVYAFKGKWQNPQQDIPTNIFYFISTPKRFEAVFRNGREELVETLEITCFGEHPFCEKDTFTMNDGTTYMICGISNNEMEHNIAVRDMLKPKIESQVLVLR